MGKKLSTYYAEPIGWGRGHCEIHMDFKEETLYIKYFDDVGKMYFTEDFSEKSLRYVENAAEDWALGVKKTGK